MFAESLLESSPHIGHRASWTKLTSLLLQCMALAVVLAIPLFHIERLQVIPPPPSIRLTSVQQPVVQTDTSHVSTGAAPETSYMMLQPRSIPTTIARVDDRNDAAPGAPSFNATCVSDCGGGIPISNIVSSGTMAPPRPAPPSHPFPVSEMQLGALVHKVLPEYPQIAKQIRLQGAVVLLATIAKNGRVEHVEPVSGPAMLVAPAMRAVEQWQYRPYVLNHLPVEVQTQITVNFVLNQ
jgi:periplasmic protein TonB